MAEQDLATALFGPDPVHVQATIVRRAREMGVDPALALSLFEQESGFNPKAKNQQSGAFSLAQFMPATAEARGLDPVQLVDDPDYAAGEGLRYFKELLDKYDGNYDKALAAYGGATRPETAKQYQSEVRRHYNKNVILARQLGAEAEERPRMGSMVTAQATGDDDLATKLFGPAPGKRPATPPGTAGADVSQLQFGATSEAEPGVLQRTWDWMNRNNQTPDADQPSLGLLSSASGTTNPAESLITRSVDTLARSMVSSTLGTPGDLVNLVSWLGDAATRGFGRWSGIAPEAGPATGLQIPIGSADVESLIKRLDTVAGKQQLPPDAAQRILGTIGSFIGPAGVTNLMRKAGMAEETIQKIAQWVTPGSPKAAVTLGTISGVAGEAAHQLAPETWMEPTAKAVAPLTAVASRAGAARLAQRLGRSTVLEQDVRTAEEVLGAAQGPAREVREARQATIRGGEEEVAQARSLAEAAAGQQRQLVQTAEEGTSLAGQGAAQARQATGETFDPLAPTLAPVGEAPTAEAGVAAQQALVQATDAERAAQARGYQDLTQTIGPRLEKLEVTDMAVGDFTRKFAVWKDTKSRLFNATEQITGDKPVVDLPSLRGRAAGMLEESAQTGMGAPKGTGTLAHVGEPDLGPLKQVLAEEAAGEVGVAAGAGARMSQDEMRAVLTPEVLARLTPEQRRVATAFLSPEGMSGAVPFWLARRIESGLGELAYGGGAQAIGTLTQGRARQLYKAVQDDLHTFFTSDVGQQILPELQEAKKYYIKGIQLYNESLVRRLLDNNPIENERFLSGILGGRGTEELRNVQANANPDTWNAIRTYALTDLYNRAVSPNGTFSPTKLVANAQTLLNSGKLDILLSSQEKANFVTEMQRLSAFDTALAPTMRKTLGKMAPEKVPQFVFAPGEHSRTLNFQSIASPDQFDQNVKAWATQFLKEAEGKTPAQIAKDLKPMTLRDGGKPSQLDTMFTHYPGVADQLTQMADSYGTNLAAQASAEQALALARRNLAEARRLGRTPNDAARRLKEAESNLAWARREGKIPAREEITLADAQEGLKDARLRAKMPPEGVQVVLPPFFRRVPEFTVGVGGLSSILYGVTTGSKYHTWMGVTGAVAALGKVGASAGWQRWANSDMGRRVLREGLEKSYAPSSVSFAARVLGGLAAEP